MGRVEGPKKEGSVSKRVRWAGLICIGLSLAGCQLFGPPGPQVLYEERFSSAENNPWWTGEQEGYRIWIAEGKYQWEVQPNMVPGVRCPSAGSFEDFVLTVEVEHRGGIPNKSGSGVIFRSTDWNNYYVFVISPTGTFRVRKVVGGTWTTLKDWTASPAIVQGVGVNRLTVIAVGPSLTFRVNDQEVYQTTDASLTGGVIGLYAVSYTGNEVMRIAFDNIVVASPAP